MFHCPADDRHGEADRGQRSKLHLVYLIILYNMVAASFGGSQMNSRSLVAGSENEKSRVT